MRQAVHTACQPCWCACYSHKSLHCVGAFNNPWYLRDCFQWGTNSLQVFTKILSSVYSCNFNSYLCIQVSQQESQNVGKLLSSFWEMSQFECCAFVSAVCVYMWEWESSKERSAEGLISADDNKSQLAQTESCSHSTPRGLDICVVRSMYTQITQVLPHKNGLNGINTVCVINLLVRLLCMSKVCLKSWWNVYEVKIYWF